MGCPPESLKPKITRKTVLFTIIGLAGFFLYIHIFQVDLPAIIATAQHADPSIYATAIALSIVEILFFAASWQVLVNFLKIKLSIVKAYLFVWYGIFVDTIIPAESVSGEALRVYLIAKEQGYHTCGRVTASLVTHRLIGMGMNVAVLILGVTLLFTETQISPLFFNLIFFLAVGITATLFLLILFSFKEKWSLKVIDWLTQLVNRFSRGKLPVQLTKIKENACRIVKSFHDAMKEFKHNPKVLVFSLFYLMLTWIFSLSIPYLVFLSLRPEEPVSWSVILITSAIVLAVKSIPVGIPFEVGIPEITMTTLYTSLGVQAGISATATILTRLITLWLRFFIGFIVQQWLELKSVLSPANKMFVEKA